MPLTKLRIWGLDDPRLKAGSKPNAWVFVGERGGFVAQEGDVRMEAGFRVQCLPGPSLLDTPGS